MIQFILKYLKAIAAITGLLGGLITGYMIPTSAWFLGFIIDIKQLQATVIDYNPRIKKLEEVWIRTDARYENIERYMREEREYRDRQERMAHKQ